MIEICLIDNGRADWRTAFEIALVTQCRALNITPTLTTTPSQLARRGGLIIFFGATVQPPAAVLLELTGALDQGAVILPVIESPSVAAQHLPDNIRHLNAFCCSHYPDSTWPSALVDEVLSLQWLARRMRKIFISYRRRDAEAIARQIHGRFVDDRFEVFLDDVTIPPSVDFQRELKWWLNDADMMLLLVSPNLESSPWVIEEIAFASLASIGLLGVRWPSHVYDAAHPEPLAAETLMDDQRLRLDDLDFLGPPNSQERQTLTQTALDRIMKCVLLNRARAIRTRLVNLLPFAEEMLSTDYSLAAGDRLGDLRLVHRQNRQELFARVLPFRPTLDTLYDLHTRARAASPPPAGLGWFYPENDPSDPRAVSLQWLLDGEHSNAPRYHRLWPYTGRQL